VPADVTAAEGAEAHTQVNHPALMQETVFAWLADVWGRADDRSGPSGRRP
jgi:hypothetical protein